MTRVFTKMGVRGADGVFRTCCELVLGQLREPRNRETLLHVLPAS